MARGIPTILVPIIEGAAARYGVDPSLVAAIINWESGFNVGRINVNETHGGFSYGLMQVQLPTARDYIPSMTPDQLMWPETNVDLGTRHFKRMLDRYQAYPTQILDALSAYNAGPGNVRPGRSYVNPTYVYGIYSLYLQYQQARSPSQPQETPSNAFWPDTIFGQGLVAEGPGSDWNMYDAPIGPELPSTILAEVEPYLPYAIGGAILLVLVMRKA